MSDCSDKIKVIHLLLKHLTIDEAQEIAMFAQKVVAKRKLEVPVK